MRIIPDYTVGSWTETSNGIVASRTFLAVEMSGTASAQIKLAVDDPEVPIRGDAHPEDASIVVVQKSGSARDESTVLVTCDYEIPTWRNSPETVSQEIRIDSTVVSEETIFDINGARIQAQYGLVTHWPRATRSGSLVTITVSKLQLTSESALVIQAIDFVETINDAVWFGWPAKTWKLDDQQVRLSRFAGYREVQYVLTYNPRDWRFFASYIEIGRVPPDATDGNGFGYFDIRELQPFSSLPITIPTKP